MSWAAEERRGVWACDLAEYILLSKHHDKGLYMRKIWTPIARSFACWAGQLRWVKIGWYELSRGEARVGRRGEERRRSLCVTNFPQVNSSHISDLLPRCAPQLSSPIIKIIPRVLIFIINAKSYLKHQLLPVAMEPRGSVEIPFCGFFCSQFFKISSTSLCVVKFRTFCFSPFAFKVLVCFSK